MRRQATVAAGVLVWAVLTAALVLSPRAAANPSGLSFEHKRVTVRESTHAANLVVTRTATDALEPVEVYWETEDREAGQLDYYGDRGWVRLGVGQTRGTISVQVFDDLDDERSMETFRVQLFTDSGAQDEVDHATVVIEDDDDPWTVTPDETETDSGETAAPAPVQGPARPPANVSVDADSTQDGQAVSRQQRPANSVTKARTKQPARPRVTPFRLQGPSDQPASTPASPPNAVTAAGVLGAIVLARVSAEIWYRWRTEAI